MHTVSKFDGINLSLIEYHFAITKFVIEVKIVFKQKFRLKYAKKRCVIIF